MFCDDCHRTVKDERSLSAKTAKLMVFNDSTLLKKIWPRLKGEISCRKSSRYQNRNGIEADQIKGYDVLRHRTVVELVFST